MAHRKFDRVQETSTSTGSGALSLAGAVTRMRRFGDVLSNADTCYVMIEHASAAEWEICLATWNTGHTLSRGAVSASSTGSAVSFSAGTKTVSLIAPAAKSIVEDNNGDISIGRNATVAGTLGVTGIANFTAAVGIGGGPFTQYGLYVGKPITGATTAINIASQGGVQSDVTGTADYNRATMSTAAASFTVTAMAAYRAMQGTIGSGSTVANQYGFYADASMNGATNNYGFYGTIAAASGRWNLYMSGTADNYLAGNLGVGSNVLTGVALRLGRPGTGAVSAFGILNAGQIQSDVTTTYEYHRATASTQPASFTVPNVIAYRATQATIGAGSAITNNYAFYVDSSWTGASNNYGYRGAIAFGSGRFNLYMDGTADNYLAGSLGIGTTGLTEYSLRVAKTMSGATTTYGVTSAGGVQSDSTSGANYFLTAASTAAASYTVAYLAHFRATQGTIGAGSTVTVQYGVLIDSGLTGATTNYGIYSSIAAGSGRWNFYAGGTAANHFVGVTSCAAAITAMSATAIPAGGTAGSGFLFSSTANFGLFFGSGAPTLSAAQGSLYVRSDGSSTSTRVYVNTNGTTGWTAITTAT